MGIQSDYWLGMSAAESAYGIAATPTTFLEAESSLTEKVTAANGKGFRPAQRGVRGVRNTIAKRESSGDVTVTASSVGIARILKAAMGNATVTALAAPAAAVRQMLFTLATADFLPSYTLQQVVPRLGGITDAYTFLGSQCSGLTLSAKAGEGVELKSSWIARELRRNVAVATASFPASLEQFTFTGAGIRVGGLGAFGGTLVPATATEVASMAFPDAEPALAVRDISLSVKNTLDSNGWNLGGNGLRQRPAALKGGAEDVVAGSMTVEYTGDELHTASRLRSDLSLIVDFVGLVDIATGVRPLLQIACPLIRLTSDVPSGNGGDVITAKVDFTAYAPTSGELVQIVHRTLDTAA